VEAGDIEPGLEARFFGRFVERFFVLGEGIGPVTGLLKGVTAIEDFDDRGLGGTGSTSDGQRRRQRGLRQCLAKSDGGEPGDSQEGEKLCQKTRGSGYLMSHRLFLLFAVGLLPCSTPNERAFGGSVRSGQGNIGHKTSAVKKAGELFCESRVACAVAPLHVAPTNVEHANCPTRYVKTIHSGSNVRQQSEGLCLLIRSTAECRVKWIKRYNRSCPAGEAMSSSTRLWPTSPRPIRDIAGFRARSVTMTSEVERWLRAVRMPVRLNDRLTIGTEIADFRAESEGLVRTRRFFPRGILVLELLRSGCVMGLRERKKN
jgi:hypothetical protein